MFGRDRLNVERAPLKYGPTCAEIGLASRADDRPNALQRSLGSCGRARLWNATTQLCSKLAQVRSKPTTLGRSQPTPGRGQTSIGRHPPDVDPHPRHRRMPGCGRHRPPHLGPIPTKKWSNQGKVRTKRLVEPDPELDDPQPKFCRNPLVIGRARAELVRTPTQLWPIPAKV